MSRLQSPRAAPGQTTPSKANSAKRKQERGGPAPRVQGPGSPAWMWLSAPRVLAALHSPSLIGGLLAIATLIVYAPAIPHDFVDYDDSDYVRANSHVQGGLTWSGLVWAFGLRVSNWHPLTWLSHMLDCQVFGLTSWGHHLTSVLLHSANTLLVFLVLKRLTGAHWRSAIVAGLFGLHPLHVESVAWISERKDVLSGFFFLLTLLAYAKYVDGTDGTHRTDRTDRTDAVTWSWYVATLLAFALGLMSKPMLVTVPFVLLLLDFWPLGRLFSPQSAVRSPECEGRSEKGEGRDSTSCVETSRARHRQIQSPEPSAQNQTALQYAIPNTQYRTRFTFHVSRFTHLFFEKIPFLMLSIASCVLTYLAQRKGGAVSTVLSFADRLANASVSYARYIRKTFWPLDLSVLYPHPGHWPLWESCAAGAFLLIVSAAVLMVARRWPYLPVGWGWFVGMLVPVIGLVQVGIQSMADRYTYLPLIGLAIMLVWGAEAALGAVVSAGAEQSDRGLTVLKIGLSVLLLGSCAILTLFQIRYWRNTSTLFERAVRVTSGNYLAYNNLGFYYENKGKSDLAMTNYQQSLQINPVYEDALNNVGHLLAGRRQYPEAIACYRKALLIRTDKVEIHNNLGNALSETGNIDEAIGHYLFVLAQQPDNADAHNNLGIALAMKGRLDEAMAHFRWAVQTKPNDAGAHLNLGNALAAQHKISEAITEFQQSLKLNPNQAQAHNNLGNAFAETGKLQDALDQYNAALALDPEDAEAHYNLGLGLLRLNQQQDAKAHFLEALRLRPGYSAAKAQLDALGARR